MKALVSLQPSLNLLMHVRGIVVYYQMQLFTLRRLREMRIIADFEGLNEVWLQARSRPDTLNGRIADAQVLSQSARAPLSGIFGFLLSCRGHNVLSGIDAALMLQAADAGSIFKDARQAFLRKAGTPARNGFFINTQSVQSD